MEKEDKNMVKVETIGESIEWKEITKGRKKKAQQSKTEQKVAGKWESSQRESRKMEDKAIEKVNDREIGNGEQEVRKAKRER